MICIYCLDGTLCFFEQERFSFSRYLPNSLLPGPTSYILKTDSFITVNGFSVESYRFQALASATDDSNENESSGFKGKKVKPEWTYVLEDTALDIAVVEDKASSCLLILGNSLFTFI
nr:protein PTHB1-like [Parasteatoda tepidariorum]